MSDPGRVRCEDCMSAEARSFPENNTTTTRDGKKAAGGIQDHDRESTPNHPAR